MSRRYSDAPINLIARIPTPEQLSAARNHKRSFGEQVKESAAASLRRMAERVQQAGETVAAFFNGKKTEEAGIPQTDEPMRDDEIVSGEHPSAVSSESLDLVLSGMDDRQAVGPLDAPAAPAPQPPVTVAFTVPEPGEPVPEPVSLEEVAALRTELIAQRLEVARLSSQLQELKSMVGSQQQVLMYLGQEMETQQMPILGAAALGPSRPKKPRVARAKSTTTAASGSRKTAQKPALNL
ncbi:MAG: hypothetical protein RI101_09875 [Nitrospira sp.]|jgi:hypothetical protein|nr:hypothetical protein [Nitrospira sp.]